jgi:triosephosphate isomerase
MRKPIVAGNWKMNNNAAEARVLTQGLVKELGKITEVECILCPPFTGLGIVNELIAGTRIGLGAQNMHWEQSGAFTGEIAPSMLTDICQYVILGHSERRQMFGETDESVNRKLKAALAHGLTPIMCIGETLEENQAGLTGEIVNRQVRKGLAGLTLEEGLRIVIAYEPIWAIGTGLAASPEDANKIHKNAVRAVLEEIFGAEVSGSIRILYGGSVKPDNAAGFFAQADIDGALVGGASLKVESFCAIAKAAI